MLRPLFAPVTRGNDMPALDLDTITHMWAEMASKMTRPTKSTSDRKSRQQVTVTCVADEYGSDTFTLKYQRKLPHHASAYCDRCGDIRNHSKARKVARSR